MILAILTVDNKRGASAIGDHLMIILAVVANGGGEIASLVGVGRTRHGVASGCLLAILISINFAIRTFTILNRAVIFKLGNFLENFRRFAIFAAITWP